MLESSARARAVINKTACFFSTVEKAVFCLFFSLNLSKTGTNLSGTKRAQTSTVLLVIYQHTTYLAHLTLGGRGRRSGGHLGNGGGLHPDGGCLGNGGGGLLHRGDILALSKWAPSTMKQSPMIKQSTSTRSGWWS